MPKISMIACAAIFASLLGTYAPLAAEQKDPVAFCGTMGELAEAIMTIRQSGVPMSKAMGVATASDKLAEVASKLILEAYDKPQYSAAENRQDAASRFRNDFEVECFKSMMSN